MARRRRKSRGKKIFLIILAVLIVLVLAIVGVGAKLYLDLSHSIEKTYESMAYLCTISLVKICFFAFALI